MNEIGNGKVVTFHYTLRNDAGDVLDASAAGSPMSYLHGAGNIVRGLERALAGKSAGVQLDIIVPPDQSYGERHAGDVHTVSRAQFPAGLDVKPGMQFGTRGPDGPIPAWVTAVDGQTVTVDFNHPLAGESLHFAVDILSIRDATPEELAHGHPHGPGGHHHHGG